MSSKRSCSLLVFVPISIVSTEHRLDLKTLAVGHVLRMCSIFRVSDLVFYSDPHASRQDSEICRAVTEYMLTPPYLRKMVIPIKRELKYVGVLPPLSLPTHAVPRIATFGSVRKGYVYRCSEDTCFAYVGLDKPCRFNREEGVFEKHITLLRIDGVEEEWYDCSVLKDDDVSLYLGPKVHFFDKLSKALTRMCRSGLIIEFTKHGLPIQELLRYVDHSVDKICTVFGSPRMDVSEVLRYEMGIDMPSLATTISSKHVAIDAVVKQGVKSVRTVEAVGIALAALNTILHLKSVCT